MNFRYNIIKCFLDIQECADDWEVLDETFINIAGQNHKTIYTSSIWSEAQLCIRKNVAWFDIPL